ncbi:MAG: hypothetical protein HY695_20570 [Deltaproteobacteria bacterium]|nr:hypothetical protein [Deltaproteobacteria bacterium]
MNEIHKTLPYRETYEFVLSHVKGRLFHFTTYDNYQGILKSGAIEPNRDGTRRGHCTRPESYGFKNRLISLFDFRMADKTAIERTGENYPFWVSRHTCRSVHLLLDEQRLKGKLIPNNVRKEPWADYIPGTECWYPEDIPIVWIPTALVVTVSKIADGI